MSRYSIRDLEQLSGIKAHTLRIWEQRYNLLSPKRTDTNIRFYDEEDLKLILNVAFLNAEGIKISRIAGMSVEEIRDHVIQLADKPLSVDDQLHALTVSMLELDEDRFDRTLSANIEKLGFEETMFSIIYPFLSKIGVLWQTGTINPAQEHFISNLVRQKMIVAIDKQKSGKGGKKFLLFLPEGELHEISLLFTSYLIKANAHQVIYLGQSTPADDLVKVHAIYRPDYLVTVLTSCPTAQHAQDYIDTLSKRFSATQILVSGYQVIGQSLSLPSNVRQMNHLTEIKTVLADIDQVLQEK